MIYCKPAPDYLPSPEACLITGITPQLCLQRGIAEHEFAAQIERAFARPGTVGVGYNSIRFDDEVTRFLFWRNLIDPYGREWQNDCGRWDLLDVVRLTWALRPEGIVWPKKEDGKPSFKLGDLARANGLLHEAAHDALSDVRATIALARLIRDKQPKLFEFAFGLHKKDRVARELGLPATRELAKPFLHVSGMFPAERGCLAVMWPLATHPTNKNELIAWDLAYDPSELRDLDVETLRLRLFTRQKSASCCSTSFATHTRAHGLGSWGGVQLPPIASDAAAGSVGATAIGLARLAELALGPSLKAAFSVDERRKVVTRVQHRFNVHHGLGWVDRDHDDTRRGQLRRAPFHAHPAAAAITCVFRPS